MLGPVVEGGADGRRRRSVNRTDGGNGTSEQTSDLVGKVVENSRRRMRRMSMVVRWLGGRTDGNGGRMVVRARDRRLWRGRERERIARIMATLSLPDVI